MLTQSTFSNSKYRLSIELLRLQSIATQKRRSFTRSYTRECRFFEPTIRICFSNSVGSKNRIRGKRVYIIFVPGGMNFGPLKYVNETFSRDEKLTLLDYSRSLIGRKSWIRLRPIIKRGANLIFCHVRRSHSHTLLDQSSYPWVR